jgi:hypothetical protein
VRLRPVSSVTLVLGVAACSAPASERSEPVPSSAVSVRVTSPADPGAAPTTTSEQSTGLIGPTATNSDVIVDGDPLLPRPASALEEDLRPSSDCSDPFQGTAESRALLESFSVGNDSFARRVLYSWTVREQIAELRQDPTLLTRAMSSSGQRGKSADLLLEAALSDDFAALLSELRFANRRFAWTNPWATALGFTGEDYGDQLLRITLREDAIVGRVVADESGLAWTFSDLAGQLLDRETVFANSERIAAIYFVDERDPAICQSTVSRAGSVMREFFLCNESMIESWVAFTPEIRAEVERGIAALQVLDDAARTRVCATEESSLATDPGCWRSLVVAEWKEPDVASDTLLGLYELGLAFPNDLYQPSRDTFARIIERLEQVPLTDEPLVHTAE